MASRTTWRWIYGVGCIYDFIVIVVIILFAVSPKFTLIFQHNTKSLFRSVKRMSLRFEGDVRSLSCSMFDRHIQPIPRSQSTGLKRRFEDLVGITAYKMVKYRPSWGSAIRDIANVVWRRLFSIVTIWYNLTKYI